ncbi:MAG: hypothetical protein ACLR3C_05455 [Eggerthella lenta]
MEVWTSTPSFADLCLADRSFDEALLPDVRLFLFCGEYSAPLHGCGSARAVPRARIANTYWPHRVDRGGHLRRDRRFGAG